MSSLRDGTPAYPHIDVPDQALYRHLSDQAPPVVRMKHLLNWTLHRSIPQALGEAPMPRLGKASAHNAELALLHAIPPHAARALTEQEKQKLAETAPLLRKVIDDTLRDLNDGLIGISWLNQSKDHEPRSLQPHPRNQSNAHAAQQLEGMQQQLHAELAAWEAQEECLQRIQVEAERYTQLAAEVREQSAKDKGRASATGDDADEDDAIAAEIDAALASHAAEDAEHGVLWTAADLDEATRAHLALADEVLQAAHELNAAAVAKRDQEPGSDIPGTETDAHLRTLELRADEIEMRLHAVGQLDALAAKYLGQVATRASQALQERTSAGLASFAAPQGEEDATEPSEQQRLDALLAGVRAPSEGAPPEPAVPHADARELLRALARPQ